MALAENRSSGYDKTLAGNAKMETNLARGLLALLARFLSGASVRWIDSQPDTCQRVYFANHTSHLDPIMIWAALPSQVRTITRPVAAKDYWIKGPMRRYLANQLFSAILIDRKGSRSIKSVDVISEDRTRLFVDSLPEGRRNRRRKSASSSASISAKAARSGTDPRAYRQHDRILPRGEGCPSHAVASPRPPMARSRESKVSFLDRAREPCGA